MQKSNFREWTLDSIEETFGLLQVRFLPILEELLAHKHEADAYEKRYITELREQYITLGGDDWNEIELENKFISPLIVFSGIANPKYSYFLERELALTIQDFELSGKVIAFTVSIGYLPTDVSALNITASAPSITALATSKTSARVGLGF